MCLEEIDTDIKPKVDSKGRMYGWKDVWVDGKDRLWFRFGGRITKNKWMTAKEMDGGPLPGRKGKGNRKQLYDMYEPGFHAWVNGGYIPADVTIDVIQVKVFVKDVFVSGQDDYCRSVVVPKKLFVPWPQKDEG